MRRLPFAAVCLVVASAMAPVTALAQTYTDAYWQLLAMDGTRTEVRATLRIDTDNVLAGAGPCNRWSVNNRADLPALLLGGIRATRMACDRMSEEMGFFDTLGAMTGVALDGARNLILTGPDGRSMEFVPDGADPMAEDCKTCTPKD